jgi:N-acetylmuramoyl-L-alanine amidase
VTRAHRFASLALALLLAACGADAPDPVSPGDTPSVAPASVASAVPSAPTVGEPEPAPGSDSTIYEPNPGAIVVAIDPGHGGCLDWGVPDPSERGVEWSEKQLTLDIGLRLRELLEAQGITVVMTREGDQALAGDDYPDLGCTGPAWRDVNGDGESGFDPEGHTRTRDELQARLDLANLARADALVSIHINSPFDGGQSIAIAFTQTYYTDETAWGATATADLAADVQSGVVDALAGIATYERGDRGTTAHNFYLVAPPLDEPTEERPNPWAQPTRGGLMPVILSEVGSITLREEHDLLASDDGQTAIAEGIVDGLRAWFGQRGLAARIGLADEPAGEAPKAVAGDGPPFWASVVDPAAPLRLRLTNTGTDPWPAGIALVAGWEPSEDPYLRQAPGDLERLDLDVPALAPGESVELEVVLPPAPAEGRALAWISLMDGGATFADLGSPALQVSTGTP